ncbi:MAG: thioredoxin [Lachnospiraceae bacterium]|nr:thioredoxin [Lachnospiraceae bacterium]
MAVLELTVDNFESEVLNSEVPVLVDFWAEWCGPCKMMGPIVDAVAEERTDIKVGKVNIDEQGELAVKYNIMSIPTLALFNKGEITKREVGAIPKSMILEMLG